MQDFVHQPYYACIYTCYFKFIRNQGLRSSISDLGYVFCYFYSESLVGLTRLGFEAHGIGLTWRFMGTEK